MSRLDIDYDEDLDDLDDDDLDDDEDDEDEGALSKVKKLKGKMDLIALVCLITGVIGIISIICAFFVGGGLFPSPKAPDIQGVYYTYTENSIYMTLYLEEETAYMIAGDGIGLAEERVDYPKVEFVPASSAQSRLSNSEYDGYDLLLLYETEYKAVGLWIIPEDESYSLVINATGYVLTPGTPSEDMGDPKNYYHTYVHDENNYIVFNEDGTAELTSYGSTTEYSFGFVDSYWLEKCLKKSGIEHALVVFTKGDTDTNNIRIFEYRDYSTLYSNGLKFYYDGPDDSVIPDEDENLGGNEEDENLGGNEEDENLGGNEEDENLGGNEEDESTDTGSTPDWEALLDTSNVTITCTIVDGYDTMSSVIKVDEYYENYYLEQSINNGETVIKLIAQEDTAYAIIDGSYSYDWTPEEVRYYCSEITYLISGIDTSTLVKESKTRYSNSEVVITLDEYGKVYSVYSKDDDVTLYCSNWGTTDIDI
ncbi:MAG: hypothetical protein IJY24_03590 [Clostridia bacterium]|nr:hypothetical protein [Clostridia bacterium]